MRNILYHQNSHQSLIHCENHIRREIHEMFLQKVYISHYRNNKRPNFVIIIREIRSVPISSALIALVKARARERGPKVVINFKKLLTPVKTKAYSINIECRLIINTQYA